MYAREALEGGVGLRPDAASRPGAARGGVAARVAQRLAQARRRRRACSSVDRE